MNEDALPRPTSRPVSRIDTSVPKAEDPTPAESDDIMSPAAMPDPIVNVFEDPKLDLKTYLIVDPVTEEAVIIDPVLDFDPRSKQVKTRSADVLLKFIRSEGYTILYILETAVHSDHLSACRYLQAEIQKSTGLRPSVVTGANVAASCKLDNGSAWPLASEDDTYDRWLAAKESLRIGNMFGQVMLVRSEEDREQAVLVVGRHILTSRPEYLSTASREMLIASSDQQTRARSWSKASSQPSQQDLRRQEAATPASECSRSSSKVTFQEPVDGSSSIMALYATQVNSRGGYIPTKIRIAAPDDGSNAQGSQLMEPLLIPRRLSTLLR